MKFFIPILLCGVLLGCELLDPTLSEGRLYAATKKLKEASTRRFSSDRMGPDGQPIC